MIDLIQPFTYWELSQSMNWKVYEHIGNPKKKTDFGLWAQKPSLRGAHIIFQQL